MNEEVSDELEVVWDIRDPTRPDNEQILEFYLRCAPKPASAGPALIVQEAVDPGDESPDEEGRWIDDLLAGFCLAVEAWCEANEVVLTEDPGTAAIEAIYAAGATEAQREKYELFCDSELADAAIDACLAVADAANLSFDDLGEIWGVTLAPDADTLLRLNVGIRALLDVKADGDAEVAVLATPEELAHLPDAVSVHSGFSAVADSRIVRVPLDDAFDAVVATEGAAAHIEAHARTSWRALLNENWHNPLSDLFLYADAPGPRGSTGASSGGPALTDDSAVGRADHKGRYRPVWEWLVAHEPVEFRTTFAEVERATGVALPNSCRVHLAHWYGYQGSAVARAILDAGWHAHHVDLTAQEVTFTPGPSPRTRSPSQ
ncbi:hypothetical protein [Rhabdothermincola salaria]|uniref:hypothetical protein n=1 Tax=Rhabdothermincola salaria TaxID=2903142 RepID=UPI001E47FDAE|nr:hypothetical protein [Rhabdothermincola salaria]MCD9625291.1 hypothetical protein [Rhabdothermincola salaria]